jgi:predicted house-cleaning noncanonical NTP pyrophosphatase (MazG superfamily)
MERQKETVLRILTEGGSIEICKNDAGENEGYDYFIETSEVELCVEDILQEPPLIHESFYGVFDELHTRYSWHFLHLEFVDEDFSEYVADKLLEKLNDPLEMWQDFDPENFEKILKIKIAQKKIQTKTGFSAITVKTLAKETEYFYQEFVDSYANEIGQKFKLQSTVETWSTFRGELFCFTGTLEIVGNAIILKNENEEVCHILPVEKFQIAAKPEVALEKKWVYEIV